MDDKKVADTLAEVVSRSKSGEFRPAIRLRCPRVVRVALDGMETTQKSLEICRNDIRQMEAQVKQLENYLLNGGEDKFDKIEGKITRYKEILDNLREEEKAHLLRLAERWEDFQRLMRAKMPLLDRLKERVAEFAHA